MRFFIDDCEHEMFPATIHGVTVIACRYTMNGESFCEWSAEAWTPQSSDEAVAMWTEFEWDIVGYDDDFRETI